MSEPNLSEPRTCRDCGTSYTLSGREQEFYAEMMSKDAEWRAPSRCKPCRDKRKASKN